MATSRLPVPKCPLWSATALSGVSTGQDCGPPTSSGDKKREGLLMSRHGSKIGKRFKIAIIIAGVLAAVIVTLFALNYWFLSGTSLNKCRGCISQTQYAPARLGQARATIIAKIGPPEAPGRVSSSSGLPPQPKGETCDYYTAGAIMDSTFYRLCYANGKLAAKAQSGDKTNVISG